MNFRMLWVGCVLACGFCGVAEAAGPAVGNVRSVQQKGRKLVDITYDVTAEPGAVLTVSVAVSDNGGATYAVPASSFSGSGFGGAVAPGMNRKIIWDAGQDWNGHFSSNIRFRVTAKANGGPPIGAPPGMVWIPGGTFVMGSPESEVERGSDETQHTVTLSGFYMSRYEVTQREYLAVVGNYLPWGDLSLPVEYVTWYQATSYCDLLNAKEGRLGSGWVYRLPTEAEWEYACRAGTTTPFHYGPDMLFGMANFNRDWEYIGGVGTRVNGLGVFLGSTPVGSYPCNAFGLFDMHGNVYEWCSDWYGPYSTGIVTNPRGPVTGLGRVIRGGNWVHQAAACRSAGWRMIYPGVPDYAAGIRPVLGPDLP